MKNNQHVIFMHLPKCGGSTVHTILDRMCKQEEIFSVKIINDDTLNVDQFIALSDEEKASIKLLKGHMDFGLHTQFQRGAEYFSLIRDPVERIISYYYFVKRRPEHWLYKSKTIEADISLYDFATRIQGYDIHNGQARLISGIDDRPALMLERALENIEQHFSFVGTIERFDESVLLLQQLYGWSTPYYRVTNQTSNRPNQESVPAEVLAAIRAANEADIALYDTINERLNAKLEALPGLDLKLRKLRQYSVLHSTQLKAKIAVKLGLKRILPNFG